MKRVALLLALIVTILVCVILVNTLRYTASETVAADPLDLGADTDRAAEALSEAIGFRTFSTDLAASDFPAFLSFLQERFPLSHAAMDRVVLSVHTPLLRWAGSDETLQPVLLAAHYDVVPVAPNSLERWDHPPFDGVQADGFVWGRGTLDDKGALIAILTAT